MDGDKATSRRTGSVRQRGNSLQVRLFSGIDPVTGRDVYLAATIKGTDKAAHKQAKDKLSEFRTQVLNQRSVSTTVPFGQAIDEWLRTSEIVDSTREGYVIYIDRYIKPVLGGEPTRKITARALENFYAEIRRCRGRCNGKPFIEKHSTEDEHDCVKAKCRPHTCKPLGASTVRQIHSIISGTLSLAERWEWIDVNPAKVARRPKPKPSEPDPPSPTEAARLSEAAFEMDEDWGTLVWLVMTTGIRRGELCALRFSRIDLDAEILTISHNWVNGKEKDTKTHQSRRIALDSATVALLRDHKRRVQERVEKLGGKFTDDLFVFASLKTHDHRTPYAPNAVTQRYKDMAARLDIKTHLHALRHYSATELLTAGIDLRTVAGRLGHGGGGATTLRVYAAWVAASDRKAAEILGSRMPKRV
ncbi:MAG TPA: tyrosine-type recombinase/integrase [Pseudonocardiaceae bacterium]|nr:tyrosine-type recombinase/integrase [Pseudonocardiaceae bacterium]